MKTVFPLLLCYVLMTAQTFALSGGPVFRTATSYVGVYSGSLRALTDTLNPLARSTAVTPNSVGLYAISIPAAATNTGIFDLFVNGIFYSGSIVGSVNPVSGNLNGLLDATNSFTSTDPATGLTVTTPTVATGYMNAKLQRNSSRGGSSALRMNGTATVQVGLNTYSERTLQPVGPTQTLVFSVSGFQQATVTPVTITGGTGTGGTGTGGTGTGG